MSREGLLGVWTALTEDDGTDLSARDEDVGDVGLVGVIGMMVDDMFPTFF